MKMEYSYKFRIYPNKVQENLIQRTFGCCRYVFNHFLAERIEQYRQTCRAPTRFQQDKELTALKKSLEWLQEVDATALQASLQTLDTAYQNFFRRVKQGQNRVIPDSRANTTAVKVTKASVWARISKCWIRRYSFRSWGL